MKQKNKNKGITLIALVITIILLLILAGVAIGQLTGNGLFDKVKLAKERSEQAQLKENAILGDYENKIGEYLDSTRNNNYQYQKLRSNIYEEVQFVDGQKYIAPCDGYFCLAAKNNDAKEKWIAFVAHYSINDTLISYTSATGYWFGRTGCELYMNKDQL